MQPNVLYFTFTCTACGQFVEQTSPFTLVYAMGFNDQDEFIRAEHSACANCVKLIEKNNLPVQARLDEMMRNEKPWSPDGPGGVPLLFQKADKAPRTRTGEQTSPVAKPAAAPTTQEIMVSSAAPDPLTIMAAAMASLAEGQAKLLALLAPKVEDEPPAAPVTGRRKKR